MSRVFSVAVLLVVVAAGCGGAARPQRSVTRAVPPTLAHAWEGRAAAIASAASAGNSCQALQLAVSLRDDVVKSEHKLPLRLRSPLVTSVRDLAARITCTPPATTVPPKAPKPPPDKHGDHEHHGQHGHGGGGGDGGGDGGNGQ